MEGEQQYSEYGEDAYACGVEVWIYR